MTLVSLRSLLFKRPTSQAGFSLLEVIITMAIVSILTTLIMFRYGSFNSAVLLKNQAYEIALAIRETQVSAISVRGEEGATNLFRGAYGFYANSISVVGANQEFILWRDSVSSNNSVYDSTDTILATERLDDRFFIQGICFTDVASCSGGNVASIAFKRPNFDAIITSGSTHGIVVIQIGMVDDPTTYRQVVVQRAGQISVR